MIMEYLDVGLSVIPTGADKRPLVAWEKYMTKRALLAEAYSWTLPIAIIAGQISGGVVCLDFDDKGSAFEDWAALVTRTAPEILSLLTIQDTPSGGKHCVYRCATAQIRNVKLAERLPTESEIAGGETRKKIVLIETRGEGGYFLVSPSPGYKLWQSDFLHLQHLSLEQHQVLISCAKSLNEVKAEQHQSAPAQQPEISSEYNVSPFDDYDAKKDPIDLLQAHGWGIVYRRNDITYLSRPGKKGAVSASWGKIKDRFYCFSTSTEFENEHIYKASAVYTILEHRGDFKAAAKALYDQGFGSRKQRKTTLTQIDGFVQEPQEKSSITINKVSDFADKVKSFYHDGREKGMSTGWPSIDNYFTLVQGMLYVFTGYPGSGKTEFVFNLTMNGSVLHGLKWAIYSPENYPAESIIQNLVEKKTRRNFFGHGRLSFEDAKREVDFIDQHYTLLGVSDDSPTLDQILEAADTLSVNGIVIDPYNELENTRPTTMSATEFIGDNLRKLRRYARKSNKLVIVTAHPAKMRRDKDGKFPVPDLYDISDSAHWRNRSDFGVVVYRNMETGLTDIYCRKCRFKYYGKVGMHSLEFEIMTGSFRESKEQSKPEDEYYDKW